MRHNHKAWLPFFLFGLGSQMQIIASLSFTDLFVLLAAPLIFTSEYPILRRNGVSTAFWLAILMMIGCAIACVANHTAFAYVLRGMATTCILPCAIVVCHWLLRKNMNGFKWILVGAIFSQLLSTYFFQKSIEVNQFGGGVAGEEAVEGIKSGTLFLMSRICPIVSLPAVGWYLQCPQLYCILAPLFNCGLILATTVSGRSAVVASLAGVFFLLIGGKKRYTMRRIGKYFWGFVIAGLIGVVAVSQLYRTAAMSGWMGEEAYQKYMAQTKGKKGVLAILMGGRMEFFCGLFACLEKPIVGFGPWAADTKGYALDFLSKYGDAEDYEHYLVRTEIEMRNGGRRLIPAHSHIIGSWLNFGILGLIFWLYVLYVLFRYLKQDCWAIPQWYNWNVAALPSFLWAIFFSPFGDRISPAMVIVACLLVRAVRQGKITLPPEMQMEIAKVEGTRRG